MRHAVFASCLCLVGCNADIAVESNTGGTVVVFESRQPRQCEVGISPQASALKLIHEGLDVRNTACGIVPDTAYPAVCGAPTGSLVLHEIPAVSLDVAERLGFREVSALQKSSGGPGYERIECKSSPYQP